MSFSSKDGRGNSFANVIRRLVDMVAIISSAAAWRRIPDIIE